VEKTSAELTWDFISNSKGKFNGAWLRYVMDVEGIKVPEGMRFFGDAVSTRSLATDDKQAALTPNESRQLRKQAKKQAKKGKGKKGRNKK
jgi:hypothetical protein